MHKTEKIFFQISIIVSLFLISCSENLPSEIDNVEQGILQGNVYNNLNQVPVMDAIVKADKFIATTDSNGYYIIENIPVGSQNITVSKSGFDINSRTIQILANDTLILNFNLSLIRIIPDSTYWYTFDLSEFKNEDDWINCLTIDHDSNIWVGFKNGLLKFDGEKWHVYPYLENDLGFIWDMTADDQNNIWIGTFNFGLGKFNGNDWTFYNMKEVLPGQIEYNTAFGLDFDSQGSLWIGTYWDGLVKFNINANEWSIYNSYNTNLDPNKEEINCVYSENDQRIWIGSDAGGAAVFDGDSTWDNLYTQPPGFIVFSSITQELDGDIWVWS